MKTVIKIGLSAKFVLVGLMNPVALRENLIYFARHASDLKKMTLYSKVLQKSESKTQANS